MFREMHCFIVVLGIWVWLSAGFVRGISFGLRFWGTNDGGVVTD